MHALPYILPIIYSFTYHMCPPTTPTPPAAPPSAGIPRRFLAVTRALPFRRPQESALGEGGRGRAGRRQGDTTEPIDQGEEEEEITIEKKKSVYTEMLKGEYRISNRK